MTMTRSKRELIAAYADPIAEFAELSEAQRHAVSAAMAIMHHDLEHQFSAAKAAMLADMQHGREEVARLNDYANGLKNTLVDQEVEIQRLRTQIALHTAPPSLPIPKPAAITPNGVPHAMAAAAGKTVADAMTAYQDLSHQVAQSLTGAIQHVATEVQSDPTPQPPAAGKRERNPGVFTWQGLDDTSREIARQMDDGQRAWRSLSEEDKRAIVLGAITELQIQQPQGKTVSIEEFETARPIWMPGLATITMNLGMTWKQMLRAANVA
jgi:hypothetical protein